MGLTRYIAPSTSHATVEVMGGRSVVADPVTLIADVSPQDCAYLNGWMCIAAVGVTSARPALVASNRGFRYLDLTLGKEIYWNGVAYIDPATGSAV